MRQELALYNPGYCARPHAVALNKMDLEDASALAEEVQQDILDAARRMQVRFPLHGCFHAAPRMHKNRRPGAAGHPGRCPAHAGAFPPPWLLVAALHARAKPSFQSE